jgi:hypothetical protein
MLVRGGEQRGKHWAIRNGVGQAAVQSNWRRIEMPA